MVRALLLSLAIAILATSSPVAAAPGAPDDGKARQQAPKRDCERNAEGVS
jgi:hypothetical protein